MSEVWIFVFATILILGALLFAVISRSSKGPGRLDRDKYRSDWLNIEQQFKRDDVGSYQLAILNADKLLDRALTELGRSGQTMGERLKSSKDSFSKLNDVWSAHKLRNQIAHESNVSIRYENARRALNSFKQALKDLGAI